MDSTPTSAGDPAEIRAGVRAVYEAIAGQYDHRLSSAGHADDLIAATEREFVLGRIAAGQRVLDLGCGTGRYTVPLAAAGARVTGLDLAEPMLAQAAEKLAAAGLTAELRTGDMTALPFEAASFDVVVSTLTLMHVPPADRQRVFAEIARVLAPGGVLLFNVKNAVFERMFAGDRFAAVDRTDPVAEQLVFTGAGAAGELRAPWHSFTPREVTLLCARAGLIVAELRGNTPVGAWLAEEVLGDPGVRGLVTGLERLLADVPPLSHLGYHLLVEAVKPL
ncbi:MAG TPA: class I SAM-dependent methyltransferase [Jatrophihabitans sp.]|nr:class I SAM-dependent methyltransferase [Jatrophihabitans sp.]